MKTIIFTGQDAADLIRDGLCVNGMADAGELRVISLYRADDGQMGIKVTNKIETKRTTARSKSRR